MISYAYWQRAFGGDPSALGQTVRLDGQQFDIVGVGGSLTPRGEVTVRASAADGRVHEIVATVRIDTPEELVAFRHGGILPYVLRQLLRQ